MFFDREESFGNEVVLYPARINFMSMAEKINYLNVAAPAGALNINEMREFVGLEPIPNGDNYYPRGYNNADIYREPTNAEEQTGGALDEQ